MICTDKNNQGKWAGKDVDKPNLLYQPVKTEEDINHLRTAMSCAPDSNYPVSISDCFVIGINGDCDIDCPVFVRGDCEVEGEMEGRYTKEEIEEVLGRAMQ